MCVSTGLNSCAGYADGHLKMLNRNQEAFLTIRLRNCERICLDQTAVSKWVVYSSAVGNSHKESWAGERKFGGVD